MTILPDRDIRGLCTTASLTAMPLIAPFQPERLQAASYDMTLGTEFIVFEEHDQVLIDLDDVRDTGAHKVARTPEQGIIIHPGQFMLGVTVETVCLPSDIAGRLDGKSSVARLGVFIHITGGNIDPGFQGPVTMELFNARRVPIRLRPGKPICQMVFEYLSAPCEKPYQGRYQHAQGVEASKYGLSDSSVRLDRLSNLLNEDAMRAWAAEEQPTPPGNLHQFPGRKE
jgi:dCTP deaminase